VLAWLARNGFTQNRITMVANQPALFARSNSFFENNLFSDAAYWTTLSSTARRECFDRLNRGVVWADIVQQISGLNLTYVNGQGNKVSMSPHGEILLELTTGAGVVTTLPSNVLVDASGFDSWWFLKLIQGFPEFPADEKGAKLEREYKGKLVSTMTKSLAFSSPHWQFPAFHAPAHSVQRGPGFASLMSLGAMADCVLL
jgi:mycobactin lysine-N-oxygenase